ncbi:MAG: tetratricopeptide repeat protein [Nitrospinae bacterium]|nr:tetratricopeptide repeat protein [Nitrospinota bacterium]MBL7019384.1 tetratricopeptide repeat protein [Nitrospinaceae bacterium]
MKTVFSVLFALLLISFPLMAFAGEGPMELPAGSNPGADMHNKAGIKHWGMGHADEALKHFKEAAGEDSSIAEIHFNEAVALDKLGDHGAATKHFAKAKKLANGNKKILDSPILNGHLGH